MIEDLQNIDLNDKKFDRLNTEQKIFQLSAQFKVPYTVSKEEALQQLKAKIANGIGVDDKYKDLHHKGSDTGQKILQHSAQFKVPYTVSKEEALRQLKVKIDSGIEVKEAPKHKEIRTIYWAAAAALVLLLFGIWSLWIRKPMVNVVVEKGQHNEYQLPDGTLVSINAESKISFKKGNFNKKRYLTLEGEAFFDVKKGGSFVINTKLADIKVLGTSFNVIARENSFKVSCLTGKILVISGSQTLIITPGESIISVNNILSKFPDKNINTIDNWRNGEFYYENTSLNLIFNELERQFNINFVLPKMEEKYFTGSFTNKNLVNALDIVCIPMGLTYEIGSNSKVFIRKKSR